MLAILRFPARALLLPLLVAATTLSGLNAAEPVVPKPRNVLAPDAALQRLVQGNQRFVSNGMKIRDFQPTRTLLATGQNPFASILSCSDSRVPPEYAFDSGLGNLFVVRVAGNFVSSEGLASLEYGSLVLGSQLIVVLGHEQCGAVSSTINAVTEKASFPGKIPSLISAIRPAVKDALDEPGDLLTNATRENVLRNVRRLESESPILKDAIQADRLKVVGAIYHLEDGRVEFIN